jgi:uncharacterized protein
MRHASAPFEEVDLVGAGVTLKGWRLPATGPKRGTLIYLHGIADNRMSGTGIAERFAQKGFDVVAYDSRAHGESGGDACTYGYHENKTTLPSQRAPFQAWSSSHACCHEREQR